jgi:short-subunit dehydrogenase
MADRGFAGTVVVVTGASSGFGKGMALRFADEGASVVLAARRQALLDAVARDCEARGGRALPVATDVSRESDVANLARVAIATFGRIDVWINNAGVAALGTFERVPLAEHEQVIRTDLLGTLYGSHVAYRRFLEQRAGILINIASELGRHSIPYYASYVAAKHGVVGLGDALRQELAHHEIDGVHVCTVMPTAHDTPFFDHVANYTGHEVQAPKPLHDPNDVVETVVRLARDPKDKKVVGADGIVKILLKTVAPRLEEKVTASYMHKTQFETAPPAPDTPGAVRSPVDIGTEVSAGRRNAA